MARADVGYTVRQAAVHVWKTIVTNTPRTTGEILKTLMDQIIISLAHTSKLLCFLPGEVHAKFCASSAVAYSVATLQGTTAHPHKLTMSAVVVLAALP